MSKPQDLFTLLFLIVSLFGSNVSAQTNSGYELISTAQGLSQGLINDILQDKDGFIWIATKGGINRYDGYTFKAFTSDPQDTNSISSNAVSNLLEDRLGRLWISTYDGGVNVYDKNTGFFRRIIQKNGSPYGLSGNRIESGMVELPDGRILVCPQGTAMNIVSLSTKKNSVPIVTLLNAPGNREVQGAGKDEKGFIWIGCTDGSIFIYTPSSDTFEMLSDGYTFTKLIEKIGTRLTARASQVFVLKPLPYFSIKFRDQKDQLMPGIISHNANGATMIDNRIPLKTGASGKLFYDFGGLKAGDGINKAHVYDLHSVDSSQNIKCLLLDRSGVLWVGMLGQGLYKYRIGNNRFKPVLPKMSIQRVSMLKKDIVYIQGWGSTTALATNGSECINPLEPIIGKDPAVSVLQARNGEYWIYWLVPKTLLRFNAGLKLLATYQDPVNPALTEQMQPMIEDSRHRIWLCGTNGALAMVDPVTGKLSRFLISVEQTAGTSVLAQTTAFYEDKAGVFWLGTEHGFARLIFKDNTATPEVKWFKNIPGNRNSLGYNYVSWFMDDTVNPDYLWVSTKGGGLNRMQKSTGNFKHYTTKQGLPNDVVYGTISDKAGNIWGSTNRGLFCMLVSNKKKNDEPVIRVFGTSDGLQADEFNSNAFGKLANGDLVFGGVNGINIFSPQKILAASFTPNVFITGILIGNKQLAPGDNTGVLHQTIEKTSSITLSYLQDVLTLEFSALDFTAPQQNKYRYQLVGIDNEWVESGTRRAATYLHLPSGNYIFKVQGSNSQGIWSNHIAELKIQVLPPWWLSWWAYITYAFVIALAIRGYLKFNLNKAKLQSQLTYEQLEAKRVKEMDTVKTQLYTNITHEFRTPLTVILGMAQQVIQQPAELFDTRMDMIVRNGRNLLNLVNQMLDLSKLETGKMKLQFSSGDVIHFLRYIVESFQSLAESQQKRLHFLTDIDRLYVAYDQEKLRQIVSNLLSNAIKFTPEKGNIYLQVVLDNLVSDDTERARLLIKVKDTGLGISEDHISFIFDRFYQSDNSHTRNSEGTGIGLALTKELVKLMEGGIIVKSPPPGAFNGSEFIVSLPLKKVAPVLEDVPYDFRKPSAAVNIKQPGVAITNKENNTATPLILLVEDNDDVLAYTASCLPDYRLAVGKDGREGFEIAVEVIPDLIITDVMMPFMDGFELMSKLRQHENTSHIPVIMLTAKADINSKIEGLQQGADAYLEKPFNKEELLVRIKKLLELRKYLQQYYLKSAGVYGGAVMVPDAMPDPRPEDAFVKKVREAVEQNLTDINFTVEKLSGLIFMSHSQLHRKLDALTGCSPNKFIRMIRLKKAKELLKNPDNTIASVAADCGYDDPGYFARVFKQEFDATPQKWRAANN